LDDDADIAALGFDDSKALTHAKRVALFDGLRKEARIGWAVNMISAKRLSRLMLQRQPVSLSQISFDATVELIAAVEARGAFVEEAFIDTVGDPATYEKRLTAAFDGRIAFTVAKKADSLYKTVGAASICAKVTRDAALDCWAFEEQSPCADREWVFGFPSLVRFSWATTKRILGEVDDAADDKDYKDAGASSRERRDKGAPLPRVAKCAWPEDDEEEDCASTMKITDWATAPSKKAASASKKRKRAKFFKNLDTVTSLLA
ncbi:ribonuclease H-like domain-containing protein, partial [Pelagophyceae sp. CCMP2097]